MSPVQAQARSSELPAPTPPHGWLVGPPDYVGVGTVGSSTSWWDQLVVAHPGVARTPGVPRDLHFFDDLWQAGLGDAGASRYHAWFPRPAGRLVGEWTPSYLSDAWVPPLLRQAAPEARLLILLRDPVERFLVGRKGAEGRQRLGITPRAAANASFSRGLYADQLLRLWAAFPRQQVLVLQYERCLRDTRAELQRTYAFLGLEPDVAEQVDLDLGVRDPVGADELVGADDTLGADEPVGADDPLGDWQAAVLARRYAPENARLADLLPELDLDLWRGSGESPRTRS